MRILVALGGNAMTDAEGRATTEAQQDAIAEAMENVADMVAAGHEVVITHGNGPQVGNLLVKNQLAAHVVPPVPLDWCGAQTQATIGYTIMNALEPALARRDASRPVATVVTRTLVDASDPCFAKPTKPVGRYVDREQAATMVEHGETWEDRGERGWRRLVASPEPHDILDAGTAATLLDAGCVVVCAGGGGVPVVRRPDGTLEGVEAVVDKDLSAALLAERLGLDTLVIATDVTHAVVGFGSPDARPIGRTDVARMEEYAAGGEFGSGSMAPKVDAALRFARTGGTSIITALDRIGAALAGEVGTIITNEGKSNA
jgi:carbamate kinase